MSGGSAGRALALALVGLAALTGCASTDAEMPPAQPPVAAQHFKATAPGEPPFDVYFAAWGEGYVIYAPGQSPIYLISDKHDGFILQQLGETASFVTRREDGSGWNILRADGPATYLLKNKDGGGWILQAPGELPTLIQPLPKP
jgi:hypothetical protein